LGKRKKGKLRKLSGLRGGLRKYKGVEVDDLLSKLTGIKKGSRARPSELVSGMWKHIKKHDLA